MENKATKFNASNSIQTMISIFVCVRRERERAIEYQLDKQQTLTTKMKLSSSNMFYISELML